jgi:hypothetical protein
MNNKDLDFIAEAPKNLRKGDHVPFLFNNEFLGLFEVGKFVKKGELCGIDNKDDKVYPFIENTILSRCFNLTLK